MPSTYGLSSVLASAASRCHRRRLMLILRRCKVRRQTYIGD